MVARPLAWLAGFGLIALENHFEFVRFGFFNPDSILRWPVPELVGWSVFFAVFSFGFGVVSGAALLWIRQRPIDLQSNRAA